MQEIIDATIVGAEVVGDDLILTLYDSSTVNAGSVRGDMGPGGTLFDIVTSDTRPDLESGDEGYVIYETDTGLTRIWTGTRWKMQEKVICTSTTRPDVDVDDEGVKIFETDTDLEYYWTGTTWFLTSAHMPLFANAAARDAAIGSGDRKVGMTVYQTAEGGLFTWNGSAWKGHPNGELGFVKRTANSADFGFSTSGGTTSGYRITNYLITVDVPANRILEIEFNSLMYAVDDTFTVSLGIFRGSTPIAQENMQGNSGNANVHARSTGVGGSQTFYLHGWVDAIKNAHIEAGSAYPSLFIVKDIGST
jgi:hypothetical protein